MKSPAKRRRRGSKKDDQSPREILAPVSASRSHRSAERAMLTLSVQQPHADLLVRGLKQIENRSWSTDYRGLLAIHAAAKIDKLEVLQLPACDPDQFGWMSDDDFAVRQQLAGVVRLVDCVKFGSDRDDDLRLIESLRRHGMPDLSPTDMLFLHGPYLWIVQPVLRFSGGSNHLDGSLGFWYSISDVTV